MRAVVVLALLFVAVGALDVTRSLHRNRVRVKADSVFLDKLKALERGNDWDTEKCYNAYQGGFYEHADRSAYKTAIQTAWSAIKADIEAVYQVRDWNDHVSQENALTYPKLQLYDSQGCLGFNPATNVGKCQETDTQALIGAPRECADVDAFLQLPENHDKLFIIGAGTKASTCKIKTFGFCHFIAFHPKAGDPATCKKVGVKKGRVSIPLVARDTQRPADLYAILKLVLLHDKVKSRLSYSKIEVFKQRQDAILLQVCYESEKDLTGFTIDLMAIMHDHHAKISQDNGPYMQRHVGDSWIADYTKGTSYGQDLCCLWKLARSTDALPHLVKLSGVVPDLTRLVTKKCAWETGVTVVGSSITAQTTPAQIGLTF